MVPGMLFCPYCGMDVYKVDGLRWSCRHCGCSFTMEILPFEDLPPKSFPNNTGDESC